MSLKSDFLTRNPKPQTLNLELETRNSKLGTVTMDKYDWQEKFEAYEQPLNGSRKGHKNGKTNGRSAKPTPELRTQIQEMDDSVEAWVPTYVVALDPKHHERQWVIDSVAPFYQDSLITDVTRIVKGGKEANVYCCTAHPATGMELIAAKLYRPRMLRMLKNDAVYKAGRILRDAEGKTLKGRREKLAIAKKTKFGQEADTQWWIGNEYRCQTELFEAGADVPKPIAYQGNTVLMAFMGEEFAPAPTLSEVRIGQHEAKVLFDRVFHNIRVMLDNHYVHGDLSAYNILYWEGDITIIDFPQLVDARKNPNTQKLLERDIRRVCDYFSRYRVESDPRQLAADLWQQYVNGEVGK